jgi:hypothetical protein
MNPAHRPKGSNDNVITSPAEQGNSKAYTLRRLAKDNPELFEQVKAGELSTTSMTM